MEHLRAEAVGLTGQLSTDVMLVGDPTMAEALSAKIDAPGMFMAAEDDLMGLLALDRDGAAIEMKERMLKGEARIDSGDGRGERIAVFELPGSGSMTHVFLSMAGSSFLSIDLLPPFRSKTGKARQGSISACRQVRMNSCPRTAMMESSDSNWVSRVLTLTRKHSSMKVEKELNWGAERV